MGRLRQLIARFRGLRPLDRSEYSHGRKRPLDSTDAMASANMGDIGKRGDDASGGGMPPPSWVKDYDEGRPRT